MLGTAKLAHPSCLLTRKGEGSEAQRKCDQRCSRKGGQAGTSSSDVNAPSRKQSSRMCRRRYERRWPKCRALCSGSI